MSRKQVHKEELSFLPFLARDNQSVKDPVAEEALSIISEDLSKLLRFNAKNFWDVVKENASLHACIDTFLRFKRRAYDEDYDDSQESQRMWEISKRIFLILFRMTSTSEASQGAPSPREQAALLYDCWLLDVPRFMDIATLYGPQHAENTRRLLQQIFSLQPQYLNDLVSLTPLLVGNLGEVVERCKSLVGSISGGELHLAPGLKDAISYIIDTCITVSSFVAAYPPAARPFLHASNDSLLPLLISVHDHLLPSLISLATERSIALAGGWPSVQAAESRVNQLALVLKHSAHQLLLNSFCQPGNPIPLPPSAPHELMSTPLGLGEEFMNLLLSVGGAPGSSHGLVAEMESAYRLSGSLREAAACGRVVLDNEQMEYLLVLLGAVDEVADNGLSEGPESSFWAASEAGPSASSSSLQHASGAATSSHAAGGAGPSTSGSSRAQAGPISAATSANVRQIQEMMPDYGVGFLTACLEAFGNDPNTVIDRLLENTLPPHLASLDPQLQHWPPLTENDKGKGKLLPTGSTRAAPSTSAPIFPGSSSRSGAGEASGSSASDTQSAVSWGGLAASYRAAAELEAARAAEARNSVPAPSAAPKAAAIHRATARVLGTLSEDIRSITRRRGEALQWEDDEGAGEYEDEYDDSFDDLTTLKADGVCDVEGEDLGSSRANVASSSRVYEDEPSCLGPGSSKPRLLINPRSQQAPRVLTSSQPLQTAAASGHSGSAPRTARTPEITPVSLSGPSAQSSQQVRAPLQQQQQRQQSSATSSRPDEAASSAAAAAARAVSSLSLGGQQTRSQPSLSQQYRPASSASQSSTSGKHGQANDQEMAEDDGSTPERQKPKGDQRKDPRHSGPVKPVYVLDGKIYNYAKEGAKKVDGFDQAQKTVEQAKLAAQEIYGLGPGGNVPLVPQDEDSSDEEGAEGGPGPGGRGRGRGRGGRHSFANKERNKAAVGNHHRKDRAMKKMGLM